MEEQKIEESVIEELTVEEQTTELVRSVIEEYNCDRASFGGRLSYESVARVLLEKHYNELELNTILELLRICVECDKLEELKRLRYTLEEVHGID